MLVCPRYRCPFKHLQIQCYNLKLPSFTSKNWRHQRSSSWFCPVLSHLHEFYFTLPSTILWLKPELLSIKAFDTDFKKNIYDSMKSCFPKGDQLLCWMHAKDNVEQKLTDLDINVLFGKKSGDIKVKGALDRNTEE